MVPTNRAIRLRCVSLIFHITVFKTRNKQLAVYEHYELLQQLLEGTHAMFRQ